MRSLSETRSTATSWLTLGPAFFRMSANDSISFQTECSASSPGPTVPAPSSLAPRPNTLRPSMGRPPSCAAASLYFWYSSRRRISSSRGIDRVLLALALPLQRLGVGHQLARLQIGQRRRHHQVLGGDLHRHRLHRLQVSQVLLGDEGDGDLQDVQLVRLAEVQQQVQRALELGQLDPVGGAGGDVAGRLAASQRRRSCEQDPPERIHPELEEM